MKPITLGLIGAGYHARNVHIPVIETTPDVRLVAIATSREQTAREAGEKFRVKSFASYEELLRKADVEAVIVCAAWDKAEEITRACLEHGKHVLVETPGIRDAAAGRELAKLRDSKKLAAQVAYCLRYAPPFEVLQSHARTAKGPRLYCFEYYPFIAHIYNLALHFCGPYERIIGAHQDAAGLSTTIRFKNGDTAVIVGRSVANCSIGLESIKVSAADFYGEVIDRTKVRVVKGMQPVGVEDWSVKSSEGLSYDPHVYAARILEASGYGPQLRAFIAEIRGGEKPRCGIEESVETAELIRAAEAAAKRVS